MNEEPKIETPRLTKLSVYLAKESPIQLYQIDLIRTEKGTIIKNYSDKTRDFERWLETDALCWKVPDGDYLVAQGRDLWMVNVEDNIITWSSLESLIQEVMARWGKLVITEKPVVETPEKPVIEAPKHSLDSISLTEDLAKLHKHKKSKKRSVR